MRPLSATEIRERFLRYFEGKGHTRVRSSSLVPHNDPTLLFTNAGMNQFKDVFTGRETRPYTRAVSAQKCVRAGGKHNDLEQVGRTARHHTFFEMLGNFSFGDYFKKEAIAYAWDFLTGQLEIPEERLWITVFRDDDEAAALWREVGVPPERIGRRDEKDNFWQMGDTGPCGPCSEIHYVKLDALPEGADWQTGEGCDGDDFLEIWNLVFMQYDRDASGTLSPLPRPSIDTGMGLERIAAVVQGVDSNYEIDLLRGVIAAVERISGKRYQSSDTDDDVSMRVIADHARATAFLIADGVLPANEGRGYVLRRIMRRAIRHGRRLGLEDLFLAEVCQSVVDLMKDAYPELEEHQALIRKMSEQEETSFRRTLDRGLKLLDEALAETGEEKVLPGEVAFRLYDTYGFPIDLTEVIAGEHGVRVDREGFEAALARQKERSAGGLGVEGPIGDVYMRLAEAFGETRFTGYAGTEGRGRVLAVLKDGREVDRADAGRVEVVLDETPFYGESGGQVGDTGVLSGEGVELRVLDTKKYAGVHVHQCEVVSGAVQVGQTLEARVDAERRRRIRANHSATHLLHKVLKEVLGEHVNQAGSLVAPDLLRFDYTHTEAPTPEQIEEIERRVNALIARNAPTEVTVLDFDEAREAGAVALFGEKYGDKVRTVRIAEESFELCGGTHVDRAGDIGCFKIVSEGSIASGVRRIVAYTLDAALAHVQAEERILREAAAALKASPSELVKKAQQATRRIKALEKELERARQKLATARTVDVMDRVREVGGVKVLSLRTEVADAKALRELADKLRDKLGSGVVVLGAERDGKAQLLVAVTQDLTDRFKAPDLIRQLAPIVGGRGGGKPDLAQAGGSEPANLEKALSRAYELIQAA
ncbi:MAG: alanine--tRNA ligase [Deltaproteobacteria bacterium]|nr:MAG: alanine--tRNA ligase [Deltaproteobacteria bacterium]